MIKKKILKPNIILNKSTSKSIEVPFEPVDLKDEAAVEISKPSMATKKKKPLKRKIPDAVETEAITEAVPVKEKNIKSKSQIKNDKNIINKSSVKVESELEMLHVEPYSTISVNDKVYKHLEENSFPPILIQSNEETKERYIAKAGDAYVILKDNNKIEWLCTYFSIERKCQDLSGKIWADIRVPNELNDNIITVPIEFFTLKKISELSSYGVFIESEY